MNTLEKLDCLELESCLRELVYLFGVDKVKECLNQLEDEIWDQMETASYWESELENSYTNF